MKTETETAIKALMKKAVDATVASEAMQFAQAALNLAHVEATLAASKKHNE
jgi:hypothetical protein